MLDASTLPPLPAQPQRPSTCASVGFCVCSRESRLLRRMARALQAALRQALKPGMAQRILYDKCALVLRLSAAQESHWFHLAFGNLNSMHCMLIRLEPVDRGHSLRALAAFGLGLVPLSLPNGRMSDATWNLWATLSRLDAALAWHVSFWQLYREGVELADIKRPSMIAVRRVLPSADRDLADLMPPRRPRGAGGQGQRRRPAAPRLGRVPPAGQPGAANSDSSSESTSEIAPELESGSDGGGMHAADGADLGEASDGSHENEADIAADMEDMVAALAGELLGPQAADDPAPAPDVVEPPPPHPAPRGKRVGGAAAERPYTFELGDDMGKLVYEPVQQILAAHCSHGGRYGAHGPSACRLNRKCTAAAAHMRSRAWQGRPIGLLVAWLRARDEECCDSRAAHFALTDGRGENPLLNFEARQAAREWLSSPASGLSADQLAQLLSLERPVVEGEGPEPHMSR